MSPDAKRPQAGEPADVSILSNGVVAESSVTEQVCPVACGGRDGCTWKCPLPIASLVTAYGRALFRVRAS